MTARTSLELAASLMSTPWAIDPVAHRSLLSLAASGDSPRRTVPRVSRPRTPGVTVIPVTGLLTQRSSMLGAFGLGTSMGSISAFLQLALADDSCDAIVLDVDSQGGELSGLPEMAAQLRAVGQAKTLVAVANSVAAAGGYWLAASCGSVYCTPGGEVGGIGVHIGHADESRAHEKAGVRVTLVHAGRHKVEGNPYGPLGADAKAYMQQRVDDRHSMFVADVAKGRKVSEQRVRQDFGQGRVLGAKEARAAGMIDGIATLDQVIADLQRGRLGATNGRLSAQVAISRAMRGVH